VGVIKNLGKEVVDRQGRDIAARGLKGAPVGRDLAENFFGRTVGVPLMGAAETVGKGIVGAGKRLARGTSNLLGGVARKTTPLRVQDSLGRAGVIDPIQLDLSNARHAIHARRASGMEIPEELARKAKNKWLGPAWLGATVGVPSLALAAHGNRGVYKDLSNAAETGVREVTANDNSTKESLKAFLKAAQEKSAARGGGGGVFGEGTGSNPWEKPGETVARGAMDTVTEFFKPTAQSAGYDLQKSIFGLGDRVKAPDAIAESAAKEFGKQTGSYAGTLLQGMVDGGINMGREQASWGPQRKRIFDQLMMSDPVISRADPEMVLQAYHSMKRFAPLLSTDQHAAQAFLREAVLHEGAMNYNTMGALSKAESEARRALGM